MNDKLPKRKPLRLSGYDYNKSGIYFITICTHNRKNILSHIINQTNPRTVGAIHESPVIYADTINQHKIYDINRILPEISLTKFGAIVDDVIRNIPTRYNVTVDQYVIMPNHIHLMLFVTSDENPRAIRESPLQDVGGRSDNTPEKTNNLANLISDSAPLQDVGSRSVISKIVGYIKMNSSKKIKQLYGNSQIWQRGYHDHIVRSYNDYCQISKYIYNNPLIWLNDCYYNLDE